MAPPFIFPETLQGLKVIDADTHYTEPHDLWTSRVPAKYRTKVPYVEDNGQGGKAWKFNDGEVLVPSAGASSVIRKDKTKSAMLDWDLQSGSLGILDAHPACYDPEARLELMDEQGVWAHVIYPNATGFSAHKLVGLADQKLASLILSIYNDAVAELQAGSGGRLFPQALIPFWDLPAALKEVERTHFELKLTGITMSSEPHSAGMPDIVDHHWDPLWDLCESLGITVNFHVGASEFSLQVFESGTWPSLKQLPKIIVGCSLLELHNAQVLANLLASDLLVRFPKLQFVSVESGIGWIPYILERLEYQLLETSLDGNVWGQASPTELFHRQVSACFWFEESAPSRLLDVIGFDNVLFESDFPHSTCLYPNPVEHAIKVLEPWGPEVQRKVLSENAARLYGIPI
jgi:predicted TIM-barrel fold metal-dependent hydrolase